MMDTMRVQGCSKIISKKFGVTAKTQLNDGVQWQSSATMRELINESVKNGDDAKDIRKMAMSIDLRDRRERLSDHAAIFAKLHFFPQ
jgi:hypothetical protein